MAEPRYLPGADYDGLKAASRLLVKKNGGPVDAAAITRPDQPNISRQIGSDPERFLAIDAVADLEAACQEPFVTRKLAQLAECLLIELPRGLKGDALTREAGLSAQAFGQLMTDFGKAVADGTVERREAIGVLEDIYRLMTALAGFAETLKAKAEATP